MPNQWIPTSEAPKDGTKLLFAAFDVSGGFHRVGVGHWEDDPFSMGDTEDAKWIGDTASFDGWDYTHFMFLPEPPNIEG